MGPVGGEPGASSGIRWTGKAGRTRLARGQSLVEFALVAPIFLLLLFAIIEYSLINAAIGSYNFAAKDAARYGAIKGPTDATVDTQMLNIINSHVLGVVAATPVEVDIYQSTESGAYSTAALQDKYIYSGGVWTLSGVAGWPPGDLLKCAPSVCRDDRLVSQDYLGVHIIYQYTYVTAFFSSLGATITLTADSVQRIEPQELYVKPTPGAAPVTAARDPLSPPSPGAPLLMLGALLPYWVIRVRAGHGGWSAMDRKERRR